MTYRWSDASLSAMTGIHPDLRKLADAALVRSKVDFKVVEGLRSAAKQLAAYKAGKSKIKSGGRHQFGCAIDVIAIDPVTHKPTYVTSTGLYKKIEAAFAEASAATGIVHRWGGTFSFGDYGHFELPKKKYPDNWKHA